MRNPRVGDSVWVAIPKLPEERKAGTIISIDKNGKEPRYTVEWETYVTEPRRNPLKYSLKEILPASGRR